MAEKSRKITRFRTKIVVLSVLCLFLVGCEARTRDYLPALAGAFTCRVEGECGGQQIEAVVRAGARGADGARDLRVVYTAPASLAGLVATLEGGTYTVTQGGVAVENSPLVGFLLPARLLAAELSVTSVRAKDKKTVVYGTHADGACEVTTDSETGQILAASGYYGGVEMRFSVLFSE